MLALQSAQGQSDASGGAHVPDPDAVPAHGAPPASQRPAVPAELPARQLARLSLLGQRAGAVGSPLQRAMLEEAGPHPSELPKAAPRYGSPANGPKSFGGRRGPVAPS